MSLALSILASGSSGNCSAIRSPRGLFLIDCGIGPRTAAGRMKPLGISIENISAICLTHLDSDHFNPNWVATIVRQGIALFCHETRADELVRLAGRSAEFARLIQTFNGSKFSPVTGATLSPIHLAHDDLGSHGFLIEGHRSRIGYATDLGRVEAKLIHDFAGVDVLAIESNYDHKMQIDSDRPEFLKRRIMNGRGHLSNDESLKAVREILDRSLKSPRGLPKHIILLHRSRQCNCPDLLRELFCSADQRIAARLVLAEQHHPTAWMLATGEPVFEQMELQWS